MPDSQEGLLNDRLTGLERRLRFSESAVLILTLALTVTIWMALRSPSVRPDDSSKILRVRGLIVEDASGRARILLGRPCRK